MVRSVQGYFARGFQASTPLFNKPENNECWANDNARMSEDEKYKDVVYFGKIDVEVLSNLSDELDVQAMPTFLLFKDGVQVY